MAISKLISPLGAYSAPSSSQKDENRAAKCARLFVDGMGDNQRDRFKRMMQSGVEVGRSIAQTYEVPLDEFIDEVRKII